jgi:hypothetical protein
MQLKFKTGNKRNFGAKWGREYFATSKREFPVALDRTENSKNILRDEIVS